MRRTIRSMVVFLFICAPLWQESVQASGLDQRPVNTTCLAPDRSAGSAILGFDEAFPGVTFSNPVLLLQVPGDLGIPGALLLAPGDPASSLIPERMS